MTAGGPAAYMYMGQGYSYLQWAHGRRGSSCLQWVHGGGDPAAYRGYMWAGDPAAHSGYMRAGGSSGCMGARGPAAYMKVGGSAAYSRHVGEEVQLLIVGIYMGQEVQLVGTWGQGITVWVHGGRV